MRFILKLWHICKTIQKENKDNQLGVISKNQSVQSHEKVTQCASLCNKAGNRPASLVKWEGNREATYWWPSSTRAAVQKMEICCSNHAKGSAAT